MRELVTTLSERAGVVKEQMPLVLLQGGLVMAFWVIAYFWGQSSDPTIDYHRGGAIIQLALVLALGLGHTGVRYLLAGLALVLVILELSSVVTEPHAAAGLVLAIIAAFAVGVPFLEFAREDRREGSGIT